MARFRYVKGDIIKTTKGKHRIFAKDNIEFISAKKVSIVGKEGGVVYGTPEEAPKLESSTTNVIDAYWVESKNHNKTQLIPYGQKKAYLKVKFNSQAIGKKYKIKIYDSDVGVLNDDKIVIDKNWKTVSKQEQILDFSITRKLFHRGGSTSSTEVNENIIQLYIVVEIEGDDSYEFCNNKSEYLKIHLVRFIPEIMRAQNPPWEKAAKVQDRWFEGEAMAKPNYETPVFNIITMKWITEYKRVLPVVKEMYAKIWRNSAALSELRNRFKEMILLGDLKLPTEYGQKVKFGDFSNKLTRDANGEKTIMLDKYFVNQRAYDIGLGVLEPLDGLFGTLGNFHFRVSVKGVITSLGNKYYEVKITQAAIYARDSFDFYDAPSDFISQPLGFWNPKDNKIAKTAITDAYYYVTNQDYVNYRKDHQKGGDFILFSDYNEVPDNYTFNCGAYFFE